MGNVFFVYFFLFLNELIKGKEFRRRLAKLFFSSSIEIKKRRTFCGKCGGGNETEFNYFNFFPEVSVVLRLSWGLIEFWHDFFYACWFWRSKIIWRGNFFVEGNQLKLFMTLSILTICLSLSNSFELFANPSKRCKESLKFLEKKKNWSQINPRLKNSKTINIMFSPKLEIY